VRAYSAMSLFGLLTKKDIAYSAMSLFGLLTKKRHCLFGDVFFLGCPVGLEPTTFRTTSTSMDCLATHLYIVVSDVDSSNFTFFSLNFLFIREKYVPLQNNNRHYYNGHYHFEL